MTAVFACVQADFDALPFAPGQFDLVVSNGSLHYSSDVGATLAGARLMLAPGGTPAVMDSPMFRGQPDGQAMVAGKRRQFEKRHGLREIVHSNVGFLTFERLTHAATP
jgi:ubiquinone/menaquinone biosynthesis C-methylase UbiE